VIISVKEGVVSNSSNAYLKLDYADKSRAVKLPKSDKNFGNLFELNQ